MLLALIGLYAAPRDLILCVGDSGHFSIEAAVELVPCQLLADDTRFESQPAESCNDTPLATSAALNAPGKFEVVLAAVAILAIPALPADATPRPALPSESNLSASSLWLREHRTIVLLV